MKEARKVHFLKNRVDMFTLGNCALPSHHTINLTFFFVFKKHTHTNEIGFYSRERERERNVRSKYLTCQFGKAYRKFMSRLNCNTPFINLPLIISCSFQHTSPVFCKNISVDVKDFFSFNGGLPEIALSGRYVYLFFLTVEEKRRNEHFHFS